MCCADGSLHTSINRYCQLNGVHTALLSSPVALQDPSRLAFGGGSFAGVAALMAAMRMPHVFGGVLVESPSLWTGEGRFLQVWVCCYLILNCLHSPARGRGAPSGSECRRAAEENSPKVQVILAHPLSKMCRSHCAWFVCLACWWRAPHCG
jgi:hypothetical protein